MKKIIAGAAVLCLAVGSALAGGQVYANRQAKKAVDERIAEFKGGADVQYDAVSVNILNGAARAEGVRVVFPGAAAPLAVEEVVVHSFRWGRGNPNQQHFEIRGIKPGENAKAYLPDSVLAAMDPAKISWTLECDYDYDPENLTLDINTLRVDEAQLGALDVELRLSNLSIPQAPPSPKAMIFLSMGLISQVKIVGASFTYENRSLLQMALEQAAREQNKTADQVRKEMLEAMDAQAKANPNPALAPVLEQVKAFINNPEKLTIRLNPPEPFGVQALQSAQSMDEKIRVVGLETDA